MYSKIPLPEIPDQFFKETGLSFDDYLLNLKIEISIGIITNTDMPLTEISNMIGYSSHSNFLEDFKKFNGVSAEEFREKVFLKSQNQTGAS
ncbi:MAG: hypothetical protein A2161_09290 [Candidatus Schekmanbacteria bacterium RBG_13_48_7]|uniref:HTH araC/xylS-type domain-containing protein n=1 Tax=Candidatus Schekmanbacteria bacterium RBG_13_48_7 TaxID=1817878 RepID=A0A1F7RXA1_9BACT|nr:MAG: hypothetical protein A2161_09290 [Candidatus Schekmanbacteria bacterium RBG_13_48_7]